MCSDPCAHLSVSLKYLSSVTLIDNFSGLLFNNEMQTIEEIRLSRLFMLKEQFGGSSSLAKMLEMSPSQLSQWLKKSPDSKTKKLRTINSASARSIEKKLGLERGWMDQPIYNQNEKLTTLINSLCTMSPDQVYKIEGIVGILREGDGVKDKKVNGE